MIPKTWVPEYGWKPTAELTEADHAAIDKWWDDAEAATIKRIEKNAAARAAARAAREEAS